MERTNKSGDEFDLIQLIGVVWKERMFILKVTISFVALGVFIAFASSIEYKTYCKLLPENSEVNQGGLNNLAGLAGFNLSDASSDVGSFPVELYPSLFYSRPFIFELANEQITFSSLEKQISTYDYLEQYYEPSLATLVMNYTIGLPKVIIGFFKSSLNDELPEASFESDKILRLSRSQISILDEFSKRVFIMIDDEDGMITIETELPDQEASTQLTLRALELLKKKVTSYKLEKLNSDLTFIRERFKESKLEYDNKMHLLAVYTDQNRNINTSIARLEETRLRNEVRIAFEVYKGLATQLEKSEIKVKEETPVFTILEPITFPLEKSKPKRKIILVLSTIAGIFIAFSFIISKHIFLNYKEEFLSINNN